MPWAVAYLHDFTLFPLPGFPFPLFSTERTSPPSQFKCNSLLPGTGLPRGHSSKESTCQCRRLKRHRFHPWVRKIPWSRKWRPTPVFLPGESHGQRSLAGYSEKDCKQSDTAQFTHTHSPPSSTENKSNIKPNNKYKSDTVLSYHNDYCFGFISELADFSHSDPSILFS